MKLFPIANVVSALIKRKNSAGIIVGNNNPEALVALAKSVFGQNIPLKVAESFVSNILPGIKPCFFACLYLLNDDNKLRIGSLVDLYHALLSKKINFTFGFSSNAYKLRQYDENALFFQLDEIFPQAISLENLVCPINTAKLTKPFDQQHYYCLDGKLVSSFNPRLIMGGVEDIKIMHDCCRTTMENLVYIPSFKFPIYIVDDHNWALYCWLEAAIRGDIGLIGNKLLHLDDHADIGNSGREFEPSPFPDLLTLYGMLRYGNIFDRKAFYSNYLEVGTFISSAMRWGLINDFWFIQGYPCNDIKLSQVESPMVPQEFRNICDIFSRAVGEFFSSFSQYDGDYQAFLAAVGGLSQDSPFFHHHYVHPANTLSAFQERSPQSIILDIDVDVDHGNEPTNAINFIRMIKGQRITPGVVTIALSPPENYHFVDVHNQNYLEKTIRVIHEILNTF